MARAACIDLMKHRATASLITAEHWWWLSHTDSALHIGLVERVAARR
jgi:hypothetical protein